MPLLDVSMYNIYKSSYLKRSHIRSNKKPKYQSNNGLNNQIQKGHIPSPEHYCFKNHYKKNKQSKIHFYYITQCTSLFFVELMSKAGEGSFMAGWPIRKNLHHQCVVIAVTGYRHDMLKVTAGFSL